MKKLTITDKIRESYIEEYLECSKVINYTDLIGSKQVKTALYKDLPNTVIDGYPFASDYLSRDGKTYSVEEFLTLDEEQKKQCDLRYYYLPLFHELYVGTTGSGKTTGCVEPQLRAISSQKNKPNLFITDPKGELYEKQRSEQENASNASRKSMVGSGDRSEKIRTYNFPEQRVTDHRIKLTLYKLDDILAGGAGLDEMIDALIAADQLEQLANME